jgi:AraC-like DNA-binding protein
MIKARLKNQQWPATYSSLDIRIHPPLWLTWWAKSLYVAIVLGAVFMIVWLYLRRLELRHTLQLEKENTRIQREMSEERLQFYVHIVQELRNEAQDRTDNEFLEKIVRYIEDNLEQENLDNTSIVNQLGMSYSTVYRKIKAATGLSINEFKRKIRMRSAEKMLISGQYTISEIGYHVGFNSVSHFRECFKEEYGCSPSEYIKRIRETK